MSKLKRTERGQALVIMVFALIALLAVLGLAVDGGTFLLEERRMQNATDAATLAGTQKLAEAICHTAGVNDAAIAAEIQLYAERNGVADPANNIVADYVRFEPDLSTVVLGRVGGGSIPTGATAISASATISQPTYFVTLLGRHTTSASASALAVTAPPLAAGGLRPIGIPVEVLEDLGEGDIFTINMENHCDDDNCTVSYIHDGQNETHAHRGWLNLAYVWNANENDTFPRAVDPNIGTGWGQGNGLMDMMLNPDPSLVLYADCLWSEGCGTGDFVAAKPGLSWGATQQTCDEIAGEISFLPVFDEVVECETQITTPRPECPHQGGQSVGYVYHIIGFTAVRITGCSQGGGEHNIEMVLEETLIGQGLMNPTTAEGYDPNGEGSCKFTLQALTLWQ
ncbi:MAG: Tad domain-containing protein [Chloroflexi bacterium]|nr:Tad domain-containing protein [Chloroflexota bacterium]